MTVIRLMMKLRSDWLSAFSDKLTRLSPDVFFPLGVWWLGTRPEEPLILAFIEGVGLFFPSGGVWWLGTIKTSIRPEDRTLGSWSLFPSGGLWWLDIGQTLLRELVSFSLWGEMKPKLRRPRDKSVVKSK